VKVRRGSGWLVPRLLDDMFGEKASESPHPLMRVQGTLNDPSSVTTPHDGDGTGRNGPRGSGHTFVCAWLVVARCQSPRSGAPATGSTTLVGQARRRRRLGDPGRAGVLLTSVPNDALSANESCVETPSIRSHAEPSF